MVQKLTEKRERRDWTQGTEGTELKEENRCRTSQEKLNQVTHVRLCLRSCTHVRLRLRSYTHTYAYVYAHTNTCTYTAPTRMRTNINDPLTELSYALLISVVVIKKLNFSVCYYFSCCHKNKSELCLPHQDPGTPTSTIRRPDGSHPSL